MGASGWVTQKSVRSLPRLSRLCHRTRTVLSPCFSSLNTLTPAPAPSPTPLLSNTRYLLARVGRTARAGSRGTAVTIAKKGQVKQFLKMRASVDGKRVRLDSSPADQSRLLLLAGRYQRCLQDLKEVLEAERTGELDPAAPVTAVDAA